MNFIPAQVETTDGQVAFAAEGMRLPAAEWTAPHLARRRGGPVLVGVRPEDIRLSLVPGESAVQGRILDVEPLGRELVVAVTVGRQVVVALAEHRFDGTPDGRGEVQGMTLAEIKALDAGGWFGERWRDVHIPTLREVLERFAGQAWIDIELKAGIAMSFPSRPSAPPPVHDALPGVSTTLAQMRGSLMAEDPTVTIPLAGRVLEVVEQTRALLRGVISGFGAVALAWTRAARPDVPTQWAVVSTDVADDAAFASRAGFDVLSPQAYAATERNVSRAHDAGLAVHICAGDSEETMARLISLGVDAVKTGRPDRLRALLSALGRA